MARREKFFVLNSNERQDEVRNGFSVAFTNTKKAFEILGAGGEGKLFWSEFENLNYKSSIVCVRTVLRYRCILI